jgi:polysaccharide biosynthesis transport protein
MSTITPPRPGPGPRPMPAAAPGRAAPALGLTASVDPIRVLRRHVLAIVVAAIMGTGFGVAAFLLFDKYYPLYSGETIFEVQPGVRDPRDIGANEIASDQLALRLANSEAMLLVNREILQNAMRNPNVLSTAWHRSFVHGDGTFSTLDAVDDLEQTLRAGVIRGTSFFRLAWRTHRAADVPVVLNAIGDAYLERRRQMDEASWTNNTAAFTSALRDTNRELETLEHEIREFIRTKGLTSVESLRHHPVAIAAEQITEQIGSIAAAINMTETALSQTGAKLIGTIEPTPEDRLEAEGDSTVSRQTALVGDISTQLRHMRERLEPRHPDVVATEGRLRAAEAEREERIQRVMRRNLEARAKQLANDRDRYRNMLDELQREAEAKDGTLRELAANLAEYSSRESRRSMLEARRDSELATLRDLVVVKARADAARVRRVQQALEPREKSFPRIEIVVPLGMLIVTALTIGIIFLREMTDHRIKSASDLSVVPNARVLGVIPDLDEDPTGAKAAELVVRNHPRSVLAESYRQACAVISRAMERTGHQTLLFMGGLPGAGTTTMLTNVAASLAASGKSVLVVDANFRRPRLAEACEVEANGPGLGDVLVGAALPEHAIQQSPAGFSVMGAGTPTNRVFERLNNGQFESVVAGLRGQYDVILFDAPPAVVAGDAMVLANRVDAAVLVVRANQEQRGLVARLIHQLTDARCESLGVLLNRARGTAGGYFRKNFETMAEYAKA